VPSDSSARWALKASENASAERMPLQAKDEPSA
jgi:hypothetical protein